MLNSDLIPRNHVPGDGPIPSEIMLIGEAPGFQENRQRVPFVGPAGMELNRYLRTAGISRSSCYTTNLAKYWPPQTPRGKQLPPSKEDILRDEPELLMELELVRPRIIGAIGAHAARYFLGARFLSMFRCHGIPRQVILCSCGPAETGCIGQTAEEDSKNRELLALGGGPEQPRQTNDVVEWPTNSCSESSISSTNRACARRFDNRPSVHEQAVCESGSPRGRYCSGERPEIRGGQDALQTRPPSKWGQRVPPAQKAVAEGMPGLRQDSGAEVCSRCAKESYVITVIPLLHPSAGPHSSGQQKAIEWDFKQLGKLLRGQLDPTGPVDQYPNPIYQILTDADGGAETIRWVLAGKTEISIDTEGEWWDPECLTFSVEPGVAFLVRPTERECLDAINAHINAPHGMCTVIFHYAGHDIPVVEIDEKLRRLNSLGVQVNKYRSVNEDGSLTIRCTMSELYLLGGVHPKGLKPSGWRLCGAEMDAYEDVVGPTEAQRSREYLERAFSELLCQTCFGAGRLAQKYDLSQPDCPDCTGSGRVPGKRQGTTKKCPTCTITTDRCPDCTDGMLIQKPDREFVFDADKGDFRWKQPQSIARFIKRKLDGAYAEQKDEVEGTVEDDAEEVEDNEYFKLRRDWNKFADRNDKLHIERILGPMPRTRLFDVPDIEKVTRYACRDADVTLRLSRETIPLLAEHRVLEARRIDAAVIPMLSRMEQVGMMIDREDCERFAGELEQELDEIRDRLSNIVGSKMNPNSPRVADLLFRQLGLPVIKLTKSKTRESIDDDVLGALKASLKKQVGDPVADIAIQVIDCVTDYRERQKLLSTYCRPLLDKLDRNGRIHTTLNYATTETGRLSSEDPNVQNIPNPDNSPVYGLRLRNLFIARPGYRLISADYSQIEMVVGAHLTQDAGMLEVFRQGLDLHTYAASLMFGIPYGEVPKYLRTQVKPLNFGCFYGLSAIGLQAQFASLPAGAIEKSEAECQELIHRYYAAFPGVLAWKKELWKWGKVNGYVETMFGRKRLMPGLRSDIDKVRAAAEREAGNHPIQGTAQDILKIGMAGIWENVLPLLWGEGIDIEPINQVHDEVLFEVEEEHAYEVLPLIENELKYAVKLSVPIKVGISVADKWGMLK